MGADLFGSFAESTCAALVVSSTALFATNSNLDSYRFIHIETLMFPLVLIAIGIIVCLITSMIGIYVNEVNQESKIESTLKYQILISTVLLLFSLYLSAWITFPNHYLMVGQTKTQLLRPYHAYLCTAFGLVAGMIIGWFT